VGAAISLAVVAAGAAWGMEWILIHVAHLVPITTAPKVAAAALLYAALVREWTGGRAC
jgi:hypothetical protein